MKHLSEMVGAFIMQGSEEMYRFNIKEISKEDALRMIRKYHYSNTLPKINKYFQGFFLDKELVGVVTLGWGTRPRHTIQRIFPSLDTKDYLEIGRMCMTEEMPRNSESQMLSQLVKWIHRNIPELKILFTWADGMVGKVGYVYQASNFIYAGYSDGEMYMKDGVKIYVRQMKSFLVPGGQKDSQITVRPIMEQMKKYGILHFKGKQYRYLLFLCDRKEKQKLMDECLIDLELPRPKDNDLSWRVKDAETGKWVDCESLGLTVAEAKATYVEIKAYILEKFRQFVMDKVNTKVDVSALEEERERIRKLLRLVMGAKAKLTDMLDKLDVMDKHYDRKYQDMHDRLDNLYDKISEYEDSIADITAKIEAVYGNQITGKQIYDILVHFEMMYYKMTDLEKKEFMKDFINSIELYQEKMDNGSIVKQINFKFGVYYEGHETMDIRLLNEKTVETVVLLSHKRPDGHINVKVEFGEGEGKVPLDNIAKRAESYKPKERVTYKMIKEYIEAKYGFKVHTAYIAEVKRDLGLPMYDAPNAVEELKQPRKHPTAEKVEAIKDALRYFEVI